MVNKVAGLAMAIAGVMAVMIQNVGSVKILSLDVPEAVEAGSEDIVLDCDFEYSEEEKVQLDIKWYFNNDPRPFYQWIPSYKGPQLISDLFKDHLNLEFEINEDSWEKHRALHIKNPLPQLSGTYMCKVSSFINEEVQQKDLLIYVPPASLTLDVAQFESDYLDPDISDPGISVPEMSDSEEVLFNKSSSLNVTCTAIGMYPMPNAYLTWGQNSTDQEAAKYFNFRSDGLTDVSLFVTIDEDQLDSILNITCTVSLPGTQFSIQEQTTFYPKGMEPTVPPDQEEALEDLEIQGFFNKTFIDDYSGEESGEQEFIEYEQESGSGSGEFSGSGELLYDPLCLESGSGVCEEGSGQTYDSLCEASGSGECMEESSGNVILIQTTCQDGEQCDEDGTVNVQTQLVEEDNDEDEPTAGASTYFSSPNCVMLALVLLASFH